jgi:putative hemolysin
VLKKLPGFVIRLLAKIIKQERINQILTKYSNLEGADFLIAMIKEFNLTLEIEGIENLPENGRCFFAANHPFGVIDGLVITKIVSGKYGKLKAIGNDAFMYIPHLRPLIAAVNVYGANIKKNIADLESIYDSNLPITHFPAGEVSRIYNNKIQDCGWQKSFITKAITKKRDIVPIFFHGRNSRFFYFVSFVRQLFRIKLNVELILLPREMLLKQNKTIKVKILKPISYQKFDKTLSHVEWAQKVRHYLYESGKNPDKDINF